MRSARCSENVASVHFVVLDALGTLHYTVHTFEAHFREKFVTESSIELTLTQPQHN